MNTNDPIKDLFARAAKLSPFGSASDFGFETRLRAALADASPSLSDWVARFSWRVSFACLPLLVALAVFLAFQQSNFLPEGIGGFVTNWATYLPVDI